MYDRKKDEGRDNPWHAPRHEEPHAFDPLLGAGVTPAVGGEFPWSGHYDPPVGPQSPPPRQSLDAPSSAPFDPHPPTPATEAEPGSGIADERIQTLKGIGQKLKTPFGGAGGAPTPADGIAGIARGLAAPLTPLPSTAADPIPAPRMTDGERAAAEAEAAERIKKENLTTGVKKLIEEKKKKDEKEQ